MNKSKGVFRGNTHEKVSLNININKIEDYSNQCYIKKSCLKHLKQTPKAHIKMLSAEVLHVKGHIMCQCFVTIRKRNQIIT